MKALALLTALLFIVCCFGIHSCNEQERADAREWLQFSQAHHCKVIQQPTFTNAYVLWECDGNFHTMRGIQ